MPPAFVSVKAPTLMSPDEPSTRPESKIANLTPPIFMLPVWTPDMLAVPTCVLSMLTFVTPFLFTTAMPPVVTPLTLPSPIPTAPALALPTLAVVTPFSKRTLMPSPLAPFIVASPVLISFRTTLFAFPFQVWECNSATASFNISPAIVMPGPFAAAARRSPTQRKSEPVPITCPASWNAFS